MLILAMFGIENSFSEIIDHRLAGHQLRLEARAGGRPCAPIEKAM